MSKPGPHNRFDVPFFGFGLGLRATHIPDILALRPQTIDWFEIITENYLQAHPGHWELLSDLKQDYPIFMHGVGLSIGSPDPIDEHYLDLWIKLIHHVNPPVVSDHLCWTGVDGTKVHDLLPVLYSDESLRHIVDRVKNIQDRLGRFIALENPSTYLEWEDSAWREADFLAEVAERADCGILLDVNNIFVSSVNHGFNAHDYLNTLPTDRVVQIHLAGHQVEGAFRIDTHDHPIIAEVFELYRLALQRFGPINSMIERDAHIPPLAELMQELALVKNTFSEVLGSDDPIPLTGSLSKK